MMEGNAFCSRSTPRGPLFSPRLVPPRTAHRTPSILRNKNESRVSGGLLVLG
jgi:hypothetical protein